MNTYNIIGPIVAVQCIFVPCAIILICMIIQMVYIKKALSGSDNPELNTANHVNLTVLLVSMLYLICIGSYGIYILPWNYKGSAMEWVQLTLRYTLPLVNAAIFPVIIILRKQSLRQRYKERVLWAVCYLARGCLCVICLPVKGVRWVMDRGRGTQHYSRLEADME